MDLLWLYQIPTVWLGILIVGGFVAASLLGLWLTRPLARRLLPEQNDFANYFFATVAIFYAVLVGLIAVACWGNYTGIDGVVSNEAVSSSDVYRDIESYPPPLRDAVRKDLRDYVEFVIASEWPAQKRGAKLPPGGDVRMHAIALRLTTFEPATLGQQAVHIQTLHDLDDLFSNRRLRLEAIDNHLPGLMWLVVLAGAVVLMFMTYLFRVEGRALHSLLTIALSVVIGLVIFLILALDRPLIGAVSIDTSSFVDALTTMRATETR
jgi:hypothetical protein